MITHDLTSLVAYKLFEHRGYTHGHHQDDWFMAEDILGLALALSVAAGPEPVVETPTPAETSQPAPAVAKRARALASPELERQALELLTAAVATSGRAKTARRLGYRSTSSVGRILRGDRALREDLAEKIVAALGAEPDEGAGARAA